MRPGDVIKLAKDTLYYRKSDITKSRGFSENGLYYAPLGLVSKDVPIFVICTSICSNPGRSVKILHKNEVVLLLNKDLDYENDDYEYLTH